MLRATRNVPEALRTVDGAEAEARRRGMLKRPKRRIAPATEMVVTISLCLGAMYGLWCLLGRAEGRVLKALGAYWRKIAALQFGSHETCPLVGPTAPYPGKFKWMALRSFVDGHWETFRHVERFGHWILGFDPNPGRPLSSKYHDFRRFITRPDICECANIAKRLKWLAVKAARDAKFAHRAKDVLYVAGFVPIYAAASRLSRSAVNLLTWRGHEEVLVVREVLFENIHIDPYPEDRRGHTAKEGKLKGDAVYGTLVEKEITFYMNTTFQDKQVIAEIMDHESDMFFIEYNHPALLNWNVPHAVAAVIGEYYDYREGMSYSTDERRTVEVNVTKALESHRGTLGNVVADVRTAVTNYNRDKSLNVPLNAVDEGARGAPWFEARSKSAMCHGNLNRVAPQQA